MSWDLRSEEGPEATAVTDLASTILIRPIRPGDLPAVLGITLLSFDGISIDQEVEARFGLLAGRDWRHRKTTQVTQEVEENAAGCFVAEHAGKVLGYITTSVDCGTRKGRIPNLAVHDQARRRGLGRRLLNAALEYLIAQKMEVVMIETLVNNTVGVHLYPAMGFVEVAQQIHYVLRLEASSPAVNGAAETVGERLHAFLADGAPKR